MTDLFSPRGVRAPNPDPRPRPAAHQAPEARGEKKRHPIGLAEILGGLRQSHTVAEVDAWKLFCAEYREALDVLERAECDREFAALRERLAKAGR